MIPTAPREQYVPPTAENAVSSTALEWGAVVPSQTIPRLRLIRAEDLEFEAAGAARSERSRRLLNVLVALVGLIVAMPLMLVIALLIKLTSSGPVVFT